MSCSAQFNKHAYMLLYKIEKNILVDPYINHLGFSLINNMEMYYILGDKVNGEIILEGVRNVCCYVITL